MVATTSPRSSLREELVMEVTRDRVLRDIMKGSCIKVGFTYESRRLTVPPTTMPGKYVVVDHEILGEPQRIGVGPYEDKMLACVKDILESRDFTFVTTINVVY